MVRAYLLVSFFSFFLFFFFSFFLFFFFSFFLFFFFFLFSFLYPFLYLFKVQRSRQRWLCRQKSSKNSPSGFSWPKPSDPAQPVIHFE